MANKDIPDSDPNKDVKQKKQPITSKTIIAFVIVVSVLSLVGILIFILLKKDDLSESQFFLCTIFFGMATAILIFGLLESSAQVDGKVLGFHIKAGGPFGGMIIVMILGLYFQKLTQNPSGFYVNLYSRDTTNNPATQKPNGILLQPDNNLRSVVEDVDSKGTAEFSLTDSYYKRKVRFKLLFDGYELKYPNRTYEISKDDRLNVEIVRKKVRFMFYFVDGQTGVPLPGVKMTSQELALDSTSNKNGNIEIQSDTTSYREYNFNISYPGYTYNHHRTYKIDETDATFQLDKNHP
jgi:hypothetical protein